MCAAALHIKYPSGASARVQSVLEEERENSKILSGLRGGPCPPREGFPAPPAKCSVSPAGLPSETQPGGQFRLARAPRTHKLRAISSSHASARHSGHRYTHADPPAAPRPRDGPSAGQWATPARPPSHYPGHT
ncbi:uncharacterized protein LOC123506578 [Portunus trituberculatus]|uniref:uncharacterized protein LOC123506578 n=1 Tax=Portunus trituberculatus TaxID=210409 RepID=UPI001E1CDE29|nr:uncharacterized protein LOC123506578 [Portunus trituberculatus]XP_045114730.1 uncharacterized protein LOC123506578 [Portunus trituberculatus]